MACMLLPTFSIASRAEDTLPSAADIGRIEREQKALPQPQAVSAEAPANSQQETVPAPQGSDKLYFVLQGIELEGAHHYPAAELLEPYNAWIGQEISLKQIYDAASAILQRYHRDGYAFTSVQVPAQKIDNGRVRIHVTEGFVSRVALKDLSPNGILAEAENTIISMRPLHMPTLEELLLMLNDLPGLKVQAVLEPDAQSQEDGALLLNLTGEFTSTGGSATLDNNGSRYAGIWELTPQLQYNGLLTDYDKTVMTGLTSLRMRATAYIALQHSLQLDLRDSLTVSASLAHSEPGYRLEAEDIRADVDSVAVEFRHVYLRSREENLSAGIKLDIRDLATDILGTELYNDRIRALRISGTYDTFDRWQGLDLVNMIFSQGLNALGERPSGSFNLSRVQGRSDFSKMEWTVSRLQSLNSDWSIYALTNGQYTTSPLLASEQFGFGGPLIGRAYDASELTGDRGAGATVELRYDGVGEIQGAHLQPFVFYDIGRVWNISRGGESPSAADAGLGVRFHVLTHLSGSLVTAWPLTRQPSTPLTSDPDGARALFSMTYGF